MREYYDDSIMIISYMHIWKYHQYFVKKREIENRIYTYPDTWPVI